MKPRHEWGPADELAHLINIAFQIIGAGAMFVLVVWLVVMIPGWVYGVLFQ